MTYVEALTVYTVTSVCGGFKTVGDNNYAYQLGRKYGDKTYRKSEMRQCKAILHTLPENDSTSVCKFFGDLKVQSCHMDM